MKRISKNAQKQLEKTAREIGISLLYLFGSCVRGDMHAQSDVDVAYISKKLLSLDEMMLLQNTLRPVLHNTTREIDLVDIHNASPLLSFRIMQEGIVLYGNSTVEDRFYRHSIKRYIDTKPLRIATQEYVHQKLAV